MTRSEVESRSVEAEPATAEELGTSSEVAIVCTGQKQAVSGNLLDPIAELG